MAEEAKQIENEEAEEKRVENLVQFLSFTLGNEEYGVDILSVQEIRSWEPVSRIPNVPDYEKGVVNLRGAIVPIIDLRERFGLGHLEYSPLTVVVVLQMQTEEGQTRIMGVVVDSVSDVIDVDKKTIQEAPNFGTKVSTEFINGLASVNDRMVMILDVEKLLKLDGLGDEDES
jgi:purine-binding chemotaxis protein CheW